MTMRIKKKIKQFNKIEDFNLIASKQGQIKDINRKNYKKKCLLKKINKLILKHI